MAVAPGSNCTPAGFLTDNACIDCLTPQQQWAIIVALLCSINNGTCDVDTILEDSACLKCLSDSQLLGGLIGKLWTAAQALGYTPDTIAELVDDTKCLACADPKALKAAAAYQMCVYIEALDNPT